MKIADEHNFTPEFMLTHFQTFIQQRKLPRLLAHYELFKKIQYLLGSILECGVFVGQGLFTFANFLEIFCTTDRTRFAIGFEGFVGYDDFSDQDNEMNAYAKSTLLLVLPMPYRCRISQFESGDNNRITGHNG